MVPGVVEPLRAGRLCFTSIIELARVVTAENWETVLPRFYGLSRREAMEVVAAMQPHPAPPIRTVVTQVRPRPLQSDAAPKALAPTLEGAFDLQAMASFGQTDVSLFVSSTGEPDRLAAPPTTASSVPPLAPTRALEVEPLDAEQSRVHLTVSKAFMRKLDAARDAMAHMMPNANHAEILEAGLELLLARAAKRRGLVQKPRKNARPAKGDHIPAHVRREVWKRDGGKCQWTLASGGICGSTRHLELDHIQPRSRGGASAPGNLRVVCKAHNDLAARLTLGNDLMNRYTSGLRGTPRRPDSARANDSAAAASPQ
jgi:5-methylcytosine-specific restriction endonuclease McrA